MSNGKKIGSGRRTGHGIKQDTRGIKDKITDTVHEWFNSIPTGVKPGTTDAHTVGDARKKKKK